MAQLHDLTALEQGAAIAGGEVSAAELVDHYLERIDRLSDELGAFVTVTDDRARVAAGTLRSRSLAGPLAGVPTAIKDLNATAGVRTTFGSAAFADFVPVTSDEVVLRVERGGLISLGKTNAPEFGSPCYTEPAVAPPAVTPWDTTRMAGGSSGGAGAAVAGGLIPLAHGSDGGGSIRIPASCCGLVGLKPTRGRVSAAPMYGDPVGLSTSGPIARTVRDAAAFLDVLAGRAVGDPFWAPEPATSYLSACAREPGRLKVARFVTPLIADAEIDRDCVRVWEETSALLESLGHDVVDIDPPMPSSAVPTFETCWSVLTALSTVPLPAAALPALRPLTRWLGERGQRVSGPEFGLAVAELRRIAAATLAAVSGYDVVLTPTLASPPLPLGAIRDDEDPAADFEAQKRFTPYTSMWNVTGSPAISLPLGHTSHGLPIGMMLAAAPDGEGTLLALSAQIEAAAPWADRHPVCW